MILTSAPVCEYHTRDPGNITSDFVKVLKTKAWQEKFSQKECSYLETPNIIKGQAASGQIFFLIVGKTLQEPQGVVLKEFWGVDVWLGPQNPQPVSDLAL